MGKHLKQEFYHLSRSWLVLLVLLALLIGSTVISSKDVIGEWCGWDTESPYMSLVDDAEFTHDMEYQLQRHTIDWVKERLSIRDTGADTLPKVYAVMQKSLYVRVMWYIAGLVLVSAVLPTVLVRLPLNTGVPQLIAKLSSRRGAALGKVFVYFIIAGAISLITVLILSGIYRLTGGAARNKEAYRTINKRILMIHETLEDMIPETEEEKRAKEAEIAEFERALMGK